MIRHANRFSRIPSSEIVFRLINRLRSICFGNEEYVEYIKLTKGIIVKLEDNVNIKAEYNIGRKGKEILLEKNPMKTKLCWFSLVNGNIDIQKVIEKEVKSILEAC